MLKTSEDSRVVVKLQSHSRKCNVAVAGLTEAVEESFESVTGQQQSEVAAFALGNIQ